MITPTYPEQLRQLAALVDVFNAADLAGYGIAREGTFEAFPGMEDAASDFIGALVSEATS